MALHGVPLLKLNDLVSYHSDKEMSGCSVAHRLQSDVIRPSSILMLLLHIIHWYDISATIRSAALSRLANYFELHFVGSIFEKGVKTPGRSVELTFTVNCISNSLSLHVQCDIAELSGQRRSGVLAKTCAKRSRQTEPTNRRGHYSNLGKGSKNVGRFNYENLALRHKRCSRYQPRRDKQECVCKYKAHPCKPSSIDIPPSGRSDFIFACLFVFHCIARIGPLC